MSQTHVAFADTEGLGEALVIDPRAGSPRLAWTYRQVEIAADQFRNGRPVAAAFVAQPGRRNVELLELAAVVRAAVYTAFERSGPVPVLPVHAGRGDVRAQAHAMALAGLRDVSQWGAPPYRLPRPGGDIRE